MCRSTSASSARFAGHPGAAAYLRDVIEVMEENQWDWAYHAFREWDGWSVEHGPDRDDHHRATTPTDRELLLRSHFARNVAPISGTTGTFTPAGELPGGSPLMGPSDPTRFSCLYPGFRAGGRGVQAIL